jgi:DNA repair protein RadC
MPGRERILDEGTGGLADLELVSLVIGGAEADAVAARLLQGGGLAALRRAQPWELFRSRGLRASQAARLLASLELGRRALAARGPERKRLAHPGAVAEQLWPRLAHLAHEEFWAVLLTSRLEELRSVRLAFGGLTQCSVLPREAFLPALLHGAPAVVFAHNHPSGDPSPSPEDRRLSMLLDEAGRGLGIQVADHLVLAEDGVHSERHGALPRPYGSSPIVPRASVG